MNKEQSKAWTGCPTPGLLPICHLMQYAAKVSAERGLLAASCYLIPKLHNGDAKESYTGRQRPRQNEAKKGLKGLVSR